MTRALTRSSGHEQEPAPARPPQEAVLRARLESADPATHARWEPTPDLGIIRVVRVYDGDTVTVLCALKGDLYKHNVRLTGVDCPEMRGRGSEEKLAATAVRDVVRALCLDKVCTITTSGCDKYGRLMGEVCLPDGQDLSSYLLRHSLARAYEGDTRCAFTPEEIKAIQETSKTLLGQLAA